MDVVIRADSSSVIGHGHVMRCLALAFPLRDAGSTPAFIGRERPGHCLDRVRDEGFAVHVLDDVDADSTDLHPSEIATIERVAESHGARFVLVDHYGARQHDFEALANAGLLVGVVDDEAKRDLRAAAWILNQNLCADELPIQASDGAVRLLGTDFALLRPQFALGRSRLQRTFDSNTRLMLTLGGGNNVEVLRQLLDAFERAPTPLSIRAVVPNGCARDVFSDSIRQSKHHVELLSGVSDMAGLMAWADVAITAGGSTCWELCCLGVPMMVLGLADNHDRTGPALAVRGSAVDLGRWSPDRARIVVEAAVELLDSVERRIALSSAASRLVDGRGAERAAASLRAFLDVRAVQ